MRMHLILLSDNELLTGEGEKEAVEEAWVTSGQLVSQEQVSDVKCIFIFIEYMKLTGGNYSSRLPCLNCHPLHPVSGSFIFRFGK
ncbi:unnamed protein product [Pleuronectes platessa]|uniref:Uncharacterized protein n=1 Tax=Pleuronectes platessa TaxID=8262 RepID=A0A9N7VLE0_PLEPL|nr:unnamed protein product [Pleuronectes platessa]